jgi:hypothetical protein
VSALHRVVVSAGFLVSMAQVAIAQTGVPFEPQAWYATLSKEFDNPAVQLQIGRAAEGAAIKAVFDDSVKANLSAEMQLAAARSVAGFILTNAAPEPPIGVVIVGWRTPGAGMSYIQTFRFPASELRRDPDPRES